MTVRARFRVVGVVAHFLLRVEIAGTSLASIIDMWKIVVAFGMLIGIVVLSTDNSWSFGQTVIALLIMCIILVIIDHVGPRDY